MEYIKNKLSLFETYKYLIIRGYKNRPLSRNPNKYCSKACGNRKKIEKMPLSLQPKLRNSEKKIHKRR